MTTNNVPIGTGEPTRQELEREYRRARRWWMTLLATLTFLPFVLAVAPHVIRYAPEAYEGWVSWRANQASIALFRHGAAGDYNRAVRSWNRIVANYPVENQYGDPSHSYQRLQIVAQIAQIQPRLARHLFLHEAEGSRLSETMLEAMGFEIALMAGEEEVALAHARSWAEGVNLKEAGMEAVWWTHGIMGGEGHLVLLYLAAREEAADYLPPMERLIEQAEVPDSRVFWGTMRGRDPQGHVLLAFVETTTGGDEAFERLLRHREDRGSYLGDFGVSDLVRFYPASLPLDVALVILLERRGMEAEAVLELERLLSAFQFAWLFNNLRMGEVLPVLDSRDALYPNGSLSAVIPFAEMLVQERSARWGPTDPRTDDARVLLLHLRGLTKDREGYRELRRDLDRRRNMSAWDE